MANVKGKYVFDKAQFAVANFEYKGFTFTSNGQTFYGIRVRPYSEDATVCWLEYINEDGTYTTAAFQDGGWNTNWDYGDGYKTVDFGSGADIPDELETWLDASATHKAMILKAGTYRFNDVPIITNDLSQNIHFEVDDILGIQISVVTEDTDRLGNKFQVIYFTREDGERFGAFANVTHNVSNVELSTFWTDVGLQIHTILEDTEVDDTFGSWYISNTNYNEVNTKPLAEITYNGETIAQLNAGETATLSCNGKKMASDVVVKVNEVESKIPEGYVKPEGTLNILQNNTTYDVSQYAEVRIATAHPYEVPLEMLMNNVISDASQATIGNVYKYTGETTDTYEYGALYILEEVSE